MVADETSQHILKMVSSVSVSESKRKTYLPPEDFSQMAGFALLCFCSFLQSDRSLIKALIATAGNGIEIDHQTDNHL